MCNTVIYCLTKKQDFLLRSQAVQRSLPRPNDVNTTILRGAVHRDQKMKSLYEVCVCSVRPANKQWVSLGLSGYSDNTLTVMYIVS